MVTLVDGVLTNDVVMIFKMDIAFYAIQGMEILSLMIRLRILSIILPISHAHLHNPNTCHTLLFRKLHDDVQNIHEELAEYINTPNWNRPIVYYDDDDDDDENLDTILGNRIGEVIKSSVEDLVPILSESEGIPEKMCDVHFRDNSLPLDISKDQFEGFSRFNVISTSIETFCLIDDIDLLRHHLTISGARQLRGGEDFHTENGEI
ncbi:hypothetical protein Tco_0980732 [Tanacetum coccineum]